MGFSSSRRGTGRTLGVLGALLALLSVWFVALKRKR